MPAVRGKVEYIARHRNAFCAFDKKPHPAAGYNRHLLMRMRVLRGNQQRGEAKAADHNLIADHHLSLDACSGTLDGNAGPVDVLRAT
jgi:hypothetical protein